MQSGTITQLTHGQVSRNVDIIKLLRRNLTGHKTRFLTGGPRGILFRGSLLRQDHQGWAGEVRRTAAQVSPFRLSPEVVQTRACFSDDTLGRFLRVIGRLPNSSDKPGKVPLDLVAGAGL